MMVTGSILPVNTDSNLRGCHCTTRAVIPISQQFCSGTVIPFSRLLFQPQSSLLGPSQVAVRLLWGLSFQVQGRLPVLRSTISLQLLCTVMYFNGAYANQSVCLAPVLSNEPSGLSHCSQWAFLSLVLVHPDNGKSAENGGGWGSFTCERKQTGHN